MAMFLFVTPCMALLAGLVGLVAGSMARAAERTKTPRASGMSR
jgi:hypothetical protein